MLSMLVPPISAQSPIDEREVLDAAFPHHFIGRGDGEGVVLRFWSPLWQSETQINLLFAEDGALKIEVFRSVGESVLLQFDKIRESEPSITFTDAISRLKIDRHVVQAPPELAKKLRSQMAAALTDTVVWKDHNLPKKNKVRTITVDPDAFDLLYYGKYTLSIFASEGDKLDETETPPLVGWMKRVRGEIERIKK